jgi:PAS domain S-box-containing protein
VSSGESAPGDVNRRAVPCRHDLNNVPQQGLDDLAKLATLICKAPMAFVAVIGNDGPLCKAQFGQMGVDDLRRSLAFAARVSQQADVLVMQDAEHAAAFDGRVRAAAERAIRWGAGVPLWTDDGHALGALCVFDRRPGELSADQKEALRTLSRQVVALFELHWQANEFASREEQRLQGMMQRLTLATDAAAIGIWDWNLATDEWYGSPVYYSMLGYEPELGPSDRAVWIERLHPDDRLPVREKILAVVSGSLTPYQYEARMRNAAGAYRWIQVIGRVLEHDHAGQAKRMVGVRMDITERKLAELGSLRLNRVYAVLSEINESIVREKDPRALLSLACRIAVDKGKFRMAWVGLVQPPGTPLAIVAHAGASPEVMAIVESLLSSTQPQASCSFTFRALESGVHGVCNDIASDPATISWRAAALAYECRAVASLPLKVATKVIGTFNLYAREPEAFGADDLRLLDQLAIDVSFALEVHEAELDRARMQQALRDSEDRFRQLAENVQEVFWVMDPLTDRMLYISPAYEKIWQRSCASVYELGRAWLDAVHPDDYARVADALEIKLPNGDYDETYRILRPDGSVRWIHARGYPVRDATGALLRVVGTAEDVTQRRQLEEQLRQSQKMDAIGQLAGGVAHDFNNILAAIMMQADLASTVAEQPEESKELLMDIKAATERAANLTRQLLAFSRRQIMQPRLVNLNDAVTSMSKMLQRLVSEDVDLQLDLYPGPLLTRADAGMLDQVLLNLVVNARDAMPAGGRLLVATAARLFTAQDGATLPDASPGRYVCLRVSDTGTGIEARHLPRIFEPFYTTKEPGKGTGLGLSTVFGIVKQHGGFITAVSEPGQSTTFEVFWRAADASLLPQAGDAPTSSRRRGSETILLVEDETVVRMLTRVVLERAGYRVLEAPNGVAALRIWEQNRTKIRLLITDMVMPGGVSGRELAARLNAQNPDLRVILTSGYNAAMAGRELSIQEGHSFIQKPATPQHLLAVVRRSLAERR